MSNDAEQGRLDEDRNRVALWRRWGPYLSARQWGTVREDYSPGGTAWDSFPHEHARSRAYRWGEDGLGGISDHWQHLCFSVALWNTNDAILKERLFGLTNSEGNHGEDAKEYWWALDSTPTHSYMRWLYKYPQRAFPYADLVEGNRHRGREEDEYELVDTGVFEESRYFDVEITYAKSAPDDICILIEAHNRGPEAAPLHLLPTVWFRNTWSWGRDNRRAQLRAVAHNVIETTHGSLGSRWLVCDDHPQLLFCENETNTQRLWGIQNATPFPKDGINDHVISGAESVNPAQFGTKGSAWYRFDVAAGASVSVRVRLTNVRPEGEGVGTDFDDVLRSRREEADEFFDDLADVPAESPLRDVQRRAIGGLLWAKKHFRYDVREWLEGDPAMPPPPPGRENGRNREWVHLYNADIISMPDEWEYPWYAAWDLAFHMLPMAIVDPDFAKEQLLLFCREWYMHPNGQLPAYEWAFNDVNPPVHAWAAWRVYKIDGARTGRKDTDFLERIFHKLLINFSWWVNRKDAAGLNVFEGGFLGLDNIGLFDRSAPLPDGGRLAQSDATSWMAMYCLNMLAIALELAQINKSYEDVATKFFEHFLYIAHAANNLGGEGLSLWNEDDGFFYDVLDIGQQHIPLKVRSFVGLIPLFAVETIEPRVFDMLPDFAERMRWFQKNRPDLCANIFTMNRPGVGERRLMSLVGPDRLRRILARMLDEDEFLSPNGLRSLSKIHEATPGLADARRRRLLGELPAGRIHHRDVRRQLELAGPRVVPRELPDDRVAATLPPLPRSGVHGRDAGGIGTVRRLVGRRRRAVEATHRPVPPGRGRPPVERRPPALRQRPPLARPHHVLRVLPRRQRQGPRRRPPDGLDRSRRQAHPPERPDCGPVNRTRT